MHVNLNLDEGISWIQTYRSSTLRSTAARTRASGLAWASADLPQPLHGICRKTTASGSHCWILISQQVVNPLRAKTVSFYRPLWIPTATRAMRISHTACEHELPGNFRSHSFYGVIFATYTNTFCNPAHSLYSTLRPKYHIHAACEDEVRGVFRHDSWQRCLFSTYIDTYR